MVNKNTKFCHQKYSGYIHTFFGNYKYFAKICTKIKLLDYLRIFYFNISSYIVVYVYNSRFKSNNPRRMSSIFIDSPFEEYVLGATCVSALPGGKFEFYRLRGFFHVNNNNNNNPKNICRFFPASRVLYKKSDSCQKISLYVMRMRPSCTMRYNNISFT